LVYSTEEEEAIDGKEGEGWKLGLPSSAITAKAITSANEMSQKKVDQLLASDRHLVADSCLFRVSSPPPATLL
jgi:hypothetical protein